MKLLLDEMWTPTIARELRGCGHDACAISEPAYSARFAGVSDEQVFAKAQHDGLTIVTDNIADYEQARHNWQSTGQVHNGIVYALDPPFNRHQGEGVIGQMVRALGHFLDSPRAKRQPFNQIHYLRRAPDDG